MLNHNDIVKRDYLIQNTIFPPVAFFILARFNMYEYLNTSLLSKICRKIQESFHEKKFRFFLINKECAKRINL